MRAYLRIAVLSYQISNPNASPFATFHSRIQGVGGLQGSADCRYTAPMRSSRFPRLTGSALAVAWLSSALLGEQAFTPTVEELGLGRGLFVQYCASCHGISANGDGPVASSLRKVVPDLTRIRQPGQPFPRSRVFDLVDGEKILPVHGRRDMPVWGKILREKSTYESAQDDLVLIVGYLESIQISAAPNESQP